MKKILLSVLILSSSILFAQDSIPETQTSLNEKGKFSLEGQIQPNFNGNVWFTSGSVRGRYFYKNNRAFRFTYSPYFTNNTDKFTENSDGTGEVGTFKTTSNRHSIGLGIEHHLGNSSKLSPYLGYGLSFSFHSDKNKAENVMGGSYFPDYNYESKQNVYWLGAFAMAGFDWYVLTNMYLGVELGLGFYYNKEGNLKIQENDNGDIENREYPGGSSASFKPNYNGGIRLGWRF